jgi:hypothetical protein
MERGTEKKMTALAAALRVKPSDVQEAGSEGGEEGEGAETVTLIAAVTEIQVRAMRLPLWATALICLPTIIAVIALLVVLLRKRRRP